MSPEEKELLRRSVALGEENNDILRSMRRSMRFSHFISIMYWVVIIGSAVGAYYFIQPYLDQVTDLYSDARNSVSGINDTVNGVTSVTNEISGIKDSILDFFGQN